MCLLACLHSCLFVVLAYWKSLHLSSKKRKKKINWFCIMKFNNSLIQPQIIAEWHGLDFGLLFTNSIIQPPIIDFGIWLVTGNTSIINLKSLFQHDN